MQLSTISLALTRLGGAFDPSSLFAGGTVAGAWYDPSDLSTMFTTDAGTTPVAMPGGGAAVSVGRMLDKSGNGNHAIAFNDTTARPELRARVNLLTYSEEFDNAAWNASSARTLQITPNTTIAPNGTLTANKAVEAAAAEGSVVQRIIFSDNTASAQKTLSIYAKKAERKRIYLFVNGPDNGGWFDLDLGTCGAATDYPGGTVSIMPAGNGWFQCFLTPSGASGSTFIQVMVIRDTATTIDQRVGDGTSGVFIWGADLRPANIGANVPAYQRIADANTYDTSGFPLYLRFDGIDDSMYTPANLNLTGTDKVSVFAGVRKLSDAAAAFLLEFATNSWPSDAGAFGLYAPSFLVGSFPAPKYFLGLRGATTARQEEYSTFVAPITNVLAGDMNIGAAAPSEIVMRINGNVVSPSAAAGDATTGNFGAHKVYIGTRQLGGNFLNGQVYGLLVVGSAVSAGNISATEQWVAQRTGIVIP